MILVMFLVPCHRHPKFGSRTTGSLRIQATYQPINNIHNKLFFKFYLIAIKNTFNDTLPGSQISDAQKEAEHFLCKDKNT